jgi:hypothetical protein
MENPGNSKSKAGGWAATLLVLAVLGGGGYYGASQGYLDWFSGLWSSPAEVRNAKGEVRDLQALHRYKDGAEGGARINMFLLVAETGELIPLMLDYDNHGLKNGDQISVTYEVDHRLHPLVDLSKQSQARTNYMARLNRVIEFKLAR